MHKLRVGIIGTGMAFERLHYPAFLQLQDKYEIVALSDPDEVKAKGWAKTLNIPEQNVFTDFKEMIRQDYVDVLDIMVPINLNFEIAKEAAKAGKAMLCEKPLAQTREEAKAFRELPRKHAIPILIAENYRYNDEINIIKNIVAQKKIGDVIYFMQNRVINFPQDMLKNKFPAKEWRQYPQFPGGAILDTGIHDIAALHHIFGPIAKVHTFAGSQKEKFSPYSVVNVNLLFQNGLTGQFSFFCTGTEMQRPFIGLRIFGTQGEIYLEERDCGTVNVAYNNGDSEQIPYKPQQGYYHELLNFYNAVTQQEPLAVPPEIGFGDTEIIFDILESARTGEVVAGDISIENKESPAKTVLREKARVVAAYAEKEKESPREIPPIH